MYVLKTTTILIALYGFLLILASALGGMSSFVHAQANPEFTYIRNTDIGFVIADVQRSQQWDYMLKSNLCFDFNPPSNANFSVQLSMKLKDKINPSLEKEEAIGASVAQQISNPATTRCDSRNLRRLVANAPFNIPSEDRWVEVCPQIKVKVITKGPWSPFPQEDVAYLGRSFLCPDGVPSPQITPVPTRTSSATPTAEPLPTRRPFRERPTIIIEEPTPTAVPTSTPTPTPYAMQGRITVFSCVQPENVTLSYCEDTAGSQCNDINLAPAEKNQSVWLDDDTNERTFIYKYKITQDKAGSPLASGKTYAIYNANARVKNYLNQQISAVSSSPESKKEVTVPGSRDLTVFARPQTCGCFFHAQAHVRDADTGEIVTALDEQPQAGKTLTYGSSDDHQILIRGDFPVSPFTNGTLDVNQDLTNFLRFSDKVGAWTGYGIDGNAYVRLYAPGYAVVKQRCQTNSKSEVHACPGGSLEHEQSFIDEKNFVGFRVACGVDVSYDWYIRRIPGSQTAEGFRVAKPANVDINKDGFINTADLFTCIDEWGEKAPNLTCDINKDNAVDALDLSLVTSLQGTEVQQEQ